MTPELRYYNILEEWDALFSDRESELIKNIYKPLGLKNDDNPQRIIISSSSSLLSFLANILGWFKKNEYYEIGSKIINLCEKHLHDINSIMDLHFYYQNKIQFYYFNRTYRNDALNSAICSCSEQIKISNQVATAFKKENKKSNLPIHVGFNQLAIILEKSKKFEELILLCEKAKKEGWNGDWDNKIQKAKKLLEK